MGKGSTICQFGTPDLDYGLRLALLGAGKSSLSDRRVIKDVELWASMGRAETRVFRAARIGRADHYMRGSPLTIQALTADSIYVANATVDTLISAHERGADITMIGGVVNGLGLRMIW